MSIFFLSVGSCYAQQLAKSCLGQEEADSNLTNLASMQWTMIVLEDRGEKALAQFVSGSTGQLHKFNNMSYPIDDLVTRLFTEPEYDSFSDFRLLLSDRFTVYLDHRNIEVDGCLDDKILEPRKASALLEEIELP